MSLPESPTGIMTATNPLTAANVVSGAAQPGQNALPGLSVGQAVLTAPVQISGQIAPQDAQALSLATPLTKPGAEAALAVAAQMTTLATPPRFLAQQAALAESQKAATPSAAALSKLAANAIEPGGELGIKRDAALMPAREPGVVVAAALANAGVVGPKSMQNKVGLSQPVMSGAAFALSAAHVTDSLALQPSVPRASEMASTALTPPPAGAVLLEDLPDKLSQMVAQRLMANIRGGAWRFDLQLHPQELGSLDVQLEMRDGRLEAQIATSSAAVKEFLGSQLHRLNESLDAAGIKGSSIDVALHQGGHENGAQGRGRGKNEAMSGTEAELHSGNLQAAAPAPGTDSGLDLFV